MPAAAGGAAALALARTLRLSAGAEICRGSVCAGSDAPVSRRLPLPVIPAALLKANPAAVAAAALSVAVAPAATLSTDASVAEPPAASVSACPAAMLTVPLLASGTESVAAVEESLAGVDTCRVPLFTRELCAGSHAGTSS